jgi:hypothetical protein
MLSRRRHHARPNFRLRICASQPSPAKPASVIAQVEGSGTIVMLIEPLRESTPEART